nr:antitoxin Xre/MbcA/ParS toxin-binding domain-containing protein [Pseudomonas citri]
MATREGRYLVESAEKAFGNATPLAFANSEAGHLSVKDELERISQGYAS